MGQQGHTLGCRGGQEGSHGQARHVTRQRQVEQGSSSYVEPRPGLRHVGEHLQAVDIVVEAGELAHDTSARPGYGGRDPRDQWDVMGRGTDVHVERQVGGGDARVALDEEREGGLHVHLVHLAKGEATFFLTWSGLSSFR